ncbi:hypothetical protein [Anaeromyxobacter diazotrophicus]|uniref:Uncharacterized protein n=1 Tax=Anaeromyxobacter diazotrophicus TaxID=2590199 RepID=A0A7I9VJU6_9BACT|nr:hypothetical protein [Anaeromyxobacter diazotrophicus]GEJ56672.1 hypothetical protein AMYX_14130 [Anaeromyxobacter diazotrophicus]
MLRFSLMVATLIAAAAPARADNLETCLTGRYPTLCKHKLLTKDQLTAVREAERRANVDACMAGRYPTLCKHDLLTKEELAAVRDAERRVNLETCLAGRYPTLCTHNLLTPTEAASVRKAELQVNLDTCLTGRYLTLCNHDWLSSEELTRVRAAERNAADAARASRPTRGNRRSNPGRPTARGGYTGSCESGHWVEEVSADGEIVNLEDGSAWEISPIDTVTTVLWLPLTDIVVCDDKLINTEDHESVDATRVH